ncbi:MAG TPA: CocE/NonD family hydrolase [Acidimicrobiales bacterium]|nr:CocE/NonD family hydrolase [Acidimicrobiales bacterium]
MDQDLRVPMSDGVVLLADRWAPATEGGAVDGHLPIVLLRSPYGRRQIGPVGRIFAERGYQAVIQSCRGTFGSGGDWEPFRNERADGRDTLSWLSGQPWFGGSVATFGPSYLGLVQWAICCDPRPFVRAIAPGVTATYFRDAVVYPGDALALETMLNWVYQVEHQELSPLQILWTMLRRRRRIRHGFAKLPLSEADRAAVGRRVEFFQDWLAHDAPGDPWWAEIDFSPSLKVAPPANFQAGWYDLFLPSQLDDFLAMQDGGRESRITIGPWTHTSPRGLAASLRDSLEWFDEHMSADGPSKPKQHNRVRMYIMGDRRWVDLPDWPPPASVKRWHLHPGRRLDPTEPSAQDEQAADRFRFDPGDPTPGRGGPSLEVGNAGRKDQRRREARADVVSYSSSPLKQPMTIAGPLSTDLYFRSSLQHTDLVVRLCVVSTRGRSTNVSDGVLRLRPGDHEPDADGVLHLKITMWPTAITIRRNERIRLQVSSGAHPLYARNTGGDEQLASATTLHVADQEVFRGRDHPSGIDLPISSI